MDDPFFFSAFLFFKPLIIVNQSENERSHVHSA